MHTKEAESRMLFIFILTLCLVALAVVVHYEILQRLSDHLPMARLRPRINMIAAIMGSLLAHTVEIYMFAAAYYVVIVEGSFGRLIGSAGASFHECAYFSFCTYTSLGFGDLKPVGPLRVLTAVEALTGLVMIAWTASFMFMQMQRFWNAR